MNYILSFFGAVFLAENLYLYILNLHFIKITFYRDMLRYYITRKLNAIDFHYKLSYINGGLVSKLHFRNSFWGPQSSKIELAQNP